MEQSVTILHFANQKHLKLVIVQRIRKEYL